MADNTANLEDYYRPSTPFQMMAGDKTNCSNEDGQISTEDTIILINQQLNANGYSSPLNFFDSNETSVSKIAECIYELLQQQKKDTEYREEMNDQYRRLQSDHDLLITSMKNLRTRAELSEREVDALKAKLLWIEEDLYKESERHRSTKDELTKTKTQLLYTKTQASHEIRKKENEYNRFKEQMQKLLSSKYNAANCGPDDVILSRKSAMRRTNGINPPSTQVNGGNLNYGGANKEIIANLREKDEEIRKQELEIGSLRNKLEEASNLLDKMQQMQQFKDEKIKQKENEIEQLVNQLVANGGRKIIIDKVQQSKDEETKTKDHKIKQLASRLEGVSNKLNEMQQLKEEIRKKENEIKQLTEKLEGTSNMLNEMQHSMEEEVGRKETEIRKLTDRLGNKSRFGAKGEEISRKESEIEQLMSQLEGTSSMLSRMKQSKEEEIKRKESEIEQLSERLDDMQQEKDEEIRLKEIEIEQLMNRLERTSNMLDEIKQSKNEEIKRKDNEIAQLVNRL
ncbi:17066_t:CDS:10, partial [Acaulospora colombiana]